MHIVMSQCRHQRLQAQCSAIDWASGLLNTQLRGVAWPGLPHNQQAALAGRATHLQRQLVRPVRDGKRTPASHSTDRDGIDSSALDTSCRHINMRGQENPGHCVACVGTSSR